MTGSERVSFDTSPFIYLLENHHKYYLPVAEFITSYQTERQVTFVTSVLSIAEFGVKPKRSGKFNLIRDFENLLRELRFEILDISLETADLASTLRANYGSLKGIDALQLASAVQANYSEFLTNDKNLRSTKEIKISLIEELL